MSSSNNFECSPFLYEQMAGRGKNQLQISSVCNAKCLFCSNKQNPFEIKRLGFRPIEDVEKGISLLDPVRSPIAIGDAIPGRISEGEAFLHPQIFEILTLIRDRFPRNYIECRTNGTMLTQEFIEKLVRFKPLLIEISLHTIDPIAWSQVINLSPELHQVVIKAFTLLKESGVEVKASLVPLVKLYGYEGLESTLKWLSSLVKRIIIWPPGYTKYTDPEIKKMLDVDYWKIANWLWKMRRKFPETEIEFYTDPTMPLNFYPREIMIDSFRAKFKKVVWFFSESAYEQASTILESFQYYVGNTHIPFLTKNKTYGGNIICSGLLMVNDFRLAMKNAIKEYGEFDLAIIPKRRSTDNFGNDLMNENYKALHEEFSFKIWEA